MFTQTYIFKFCFNLQNVIALSSVHTIQFLEPISIQTQRNYSVTTE